MACSRANLSAITGLLERLSRLMGWADRGYDDDTDEMLMKMQNVCCTIMSSQVSASWLGAIQASCIFGFLPSRFLLEPWLWGARTTP